MQRNLTLNTVSILLFAAVTGSAQDSPAPRHMAEDDKPFLLTYPNLENSDGEVMLTNDHVVLQRFIVGPGEWEGIHSHPGNQIFVHIKGGEWSGRLGGKTEYSGSISPDGGVGWMDAIPLSAGHNSGNTGETPIDLIYVTLKDDAPIAPDADHAPQAYPNIPLELLLENDRMIVQRVQIEPGQWTGVHSHPGNQVYLHIKDGTWSERRGDVQAAPSAFMQAGSVGWMDALDMNEGHDMGNTGDSTMEFVLVTIK